jgi:SAM-dependent methyltransferase
VRGTQDYAYRVIYNGGLPQRQVRYYFPDVVTTTSKWPKNLPPLTPAQQAISDDFVHYWHEVLPRRFGMIEKFNHSYSVRHAPAVFTRTLEVGAGRGEHLLYELLSPEQRREYYALELRSNMCAAISERFPDVHVVEGDCQQKLDFPDGFFDRILAIHVLEHLPNLPATVAELHRVCAKDGVFSVVIPCEGGLAYGLARRISAQRIFQKRYKQSYSWFIQREHLNRPAEIIGELGKHFRTSGATYFPLSVPSQFFNLAMGFTCTPRGVRD